MGFVPWLIDGWTASMDVTKFRVWKAADFVHPTSIGHHLPAS